MDVIAYVIAAVAFAAAGGVGILLARLSNKVTSTAVKQLENRFNKNRREGLTSDFDMK
ncbi:hypothetical protein [Herbiconiux sp. UC225_62]|uniref:hypothetical protein n=1 Tax=Herbiconiux sp. UC225_62 TaxID=3350168 RepID=UPI0036D3958E